MRTRTEAARYTEALLDGSYNKDNIKLVSKKSASHFGKVELRTLFDFVWEGEPKDPDEAIGNRRLRNNTAAKNKRFDGDRGIS